LDHSSGHAFLSPAGDIFYSPNSSRTVEVPVVPGASEEYLFHLPKLRFDTFLSPRWWTKPYHYLSFVPLRPSFDGLEGALVTIAHLLHVGSRLRARAALNPIPPSLLGFKKSFKSLRAARLRVAASRDWFLMWMTLISSKIADIETRTEVDNCKDWFSILAAGGLPQAWLSSLQSSIVCDFSSFCPRVGTFLNILHPQPDQPPVEWFYYWNISVWYYWGSGNPKLGHLQPPAHILQAATTFISKAPSSSSLPAVPPTSHSPTSYPPPPTKNAYLASKPWEAFFTAREKHNAQLLVDETPQKRQIRLSREINPPTTSADVFTWDWSEGGTMELVRRRVLKDDREDVLGNYTGGDRIYDSFSNVWDVCEYFGDADPRYEETSIHDHDDEDDLEPPVDPSTAQKECQAYVDERISHNLTCHSYATHVAPSRLTSEVSLVLPIGELDVYDHLALRFGFVGPIPIPLNDSAAINLSDWDECLNDCLFLLDNAILHEKSAWHIAVTTSANALYVLRKLLSCQQPLSAVIVAQLLADEGIPFHTLLELHSLPLTMSLNSIETKIPRRVAGHRFGPADYASYIAHRGHLLATPRGRAALLHGGIVTRLAREHMGIESASFGPSSAVTIHRLGYSFTATSNITYWDDALTQQELEVICGLHYCFTGNGDQIAMLSWWPLPAHWNNKNNSYNWGHWTEMDETWYQDRLKYIQDGDKKYGVPLNPTEWRSKLK
ncbi:hypothetical protein GALMADRAFT_23072, partial [Galerina marginata CBS 339.88]